MRKLFKGGNYSRAETIRGNTVFKNSDSVPRYRDRKFFLQEMSTKRFEIDHIYLALTYLLNEPARLTIFKMLSFV